MSDCTHKYAKKIISAADELKRVKDGDRVVTGHACGEPPTLVEALVAHVPELKGVDVAHMVAMLNSDSRLPMRGQMDTLTGHQ